MMLYPAMNTLTSYVPNRYMLVNVVARRARQIAETAEECGQLYNDEALIPMWFSDVHWGCQCLNILFHKETAQQTYGSSFSFLMVYCITR